MTIVLDVVGVPQPQGNKTAFKTPAGMRVVEGRRPAAREAFRSWREAVAQAARDWQAEHHEPLLDEPLAVVYAFRLPRPKSAPKRRVWPTGRPDVEKLARACSDPLTGIIWRDDSLVVAMTLTKSYAVDVPPGCTITIEALT